MLLHFKLSDEFISPVLTGFLQLSSSPSLRTQSHAMCHLCLFYLYTPPFWATKRTNECLSYNQLLVIIFTDQDVSCSEAVIFHCILTQQRSIFKHALGYIHYYMYSSPTKARNEDKITQMIHAYFMFVWNTSCGAAVKKRKKTVKTYTIIVW